MSDVTVFSSTGRCAMRKYHNQLTEYRGRTYHSRLEATHARELDLLARAGEVIEWTPQVEIPLVVNEVPVTTYVADFVVKYRDGRCQLHECKGMATREWKLKEKLLRATWLREHPEVELVVIRA